LSASSLDRFLWFVLPVSLIDVSTCLSITAWDLLDLSDADNSEGGYIHGPNECPALMLGSNAPALSLCNKYGLKDLIGRVSI
jgi:hypothetical protein